MHRKLVALSLLGLSAWLGACMGQPVGLSAQRGSTIAIALQGTNPTSPAAAPIGFGGTLYDDVQRGALVFQLDGPGGFELSTRIGLEAEISRRLYQPSPTVSRQIFVMVDIPTDAPLGTHSLHLVRRLNGVDTPVVPAYQGEIQILPESIEVPLAGGGTETIVGTPTPFQYYGSLGGPPAWNDITPVIAVPQPSFKAKLNKVNGAQGDARRASSLVAQLTYPDTKVNLLRIVAHAPEQDHFWMVDQGGTATIHGVGMTASALDAFVVVFENADTAPVLDSEFQLSLVKATDQFGSNAIMTDWSLVLNKGAID